jgi:hypothetical protein
MQAWRNWFTQITQNDSPFRHGGSSPPACNSLFLFVFANMLKHDNSDKEAVNFVRNYLLDFRQCDQVQEELAYLASQMIEILFLKQKEFLKQNGRLGVYFTISKNDDRFNQFCKLYMLNPFIRSYPINTPTAYNKIDI